MRKAFMSLSFALAALSAALLAAAAPARADGTINLIDLAELSGSGATVGTNLKNGIDLAVEEINAKGGILGAKIVVTHADTQSNAGVAKGAGPRRRWTARLTRCSAPAIPDPSRSLRRSPPRRASPRSWAARPPN